MTRRVKHYVGRMVRINSRLFEVISQRARTRGVRLDNYFLVARATGQVRRLICYGSNLRLAVSPADVVII